MKSTKKIALLSAVVSALGLALVACAEDTDTPNTPGPATEYYTVTYNLNGGTGTLPTETNKAKDEKFNLASADGLSKGELYFAGWNDGTLTYKAGAEYKMPAHDVTFTAQWSEEQQAALYTVTFDLGEYDGTEDAPDPLDGDADNPITLPAVGVDWDGHSFTGWLEEGTEGDPLAAGDSYAPTKDVTLTAQWEEDPSGSEIIYADLDLDEQAFIYLYADGTGELDYSDESLDAKTVAFTYTLDGEDISIQLGGATFNGTFTGSLLTVNITYAGQTFRFGEEQPLGKPEISFNANGGTGVAPEIADEDITYNEKAGMYTFRLPECTYTPPAGKKFKAWGVNNANNTYRPGQNYMANAGEKITLIAVWEDETPQEPELNGVTFTGEITLPTKKGAFGTTAGGETIVQVTIDNTDPQSIKVYYRIKGDTIKEASKEGSADEKWKPDDVYGEDALYYGTYKIGSLSYNLLVKADWTRLQFCDSDDEVLDGCELTVDGEAPEPPVTTYTVTYAKPEGVEGTAPEPETVENGEQVTLAPANTFTKAGWTFYNWQVTGYSNLRAPNTKITVTENVTITPVFKVEYTGDYGKFIVLDNDTLMDSEGGPYGYTRTGDIVVIDFGDYIVTVKVNDAAKTYVMADGMENITFTAKNGANLTFDGFGNATLATHNGTYTLSEDYTKFTLNIGGETYSDIVMNLNSVPYTIDVKITIDGVDYVFGNAQTEEPDPNPPATDSKLADFASADTSGVMYGYASVDSAKSAGQDITATNSTGAERTFYQAKVFKNYSGKLSITITASVGSLSSPKDSAGADIVLDENTPNQTVYITSGSWANKFVISFSKNSEGKRVMTITYGDITVTWVEMA